MKVSVVVPTYRRPEVLARCLDAIAAQSRPADEVIVVAREDDEPTRRLIRGERGRGRLAIREQLVEAPGQVEALSKGVASATHDVVAITDDDAAPRGSWLADLLSRFGDPTVVGVGGRDVTADSGREPPATEVGRVRWYGKVIGNHHLGAGPARDVEVLKGVNMSFRRSQLQEYGFDPRLRGKGAQVHNDLQLSLTLRRAGGRLVYDPALVVDHMPAARPGGDRRDRASFEQQRDAVHNETVALLEFLPSPRRLAFMAWALAVGRRQSPGLLRTAVAIARREEPHPGTRLRATLGGRLDGWRTYRAGRGAA